MSSPTPHRKRVRSRRPRLTLRRSPSRRLLGIGTALATVAAVMVVGGSSPDLSLRPTADLSQFTAGNLISDDVFFFGSAMSASDVQTWLNAKNGSCVPGSDGSPCLRNFRQDTADRSSDSNCGGYVGAPQESAATIIAKVAVSCGISAKVLLVMLQKEQGLVTDSGPSLYAKRYQRAMGFACPDTAPCDAQYYGFQNQVFMAAWQMQKYAHNPGNYTYRAGRTVNIYYNPDPSCGAGPVYIQNQATAGLYNYTPYQPNAAALRGGGDACSAYGNRNFWAYFTDWFGSTQSDAVVAASPRGVVDSLISTPSGFTASGWSYDPDAPSTPVTVRATVDGTSAGTVTTSLSRPDVASAFGVGSTTGWTLSGLLSYGDHEVCLTADNVAGPGVERVLGCQLVSFTNQPPKLTLDAFAEQPDGAVRISGWAYDPDGTPTQVHVYDNGVGTAYGTGLARPDVQAAVPGAGATTGFSMTLGPYSSSHQVCVFAVDTTAPGNNWLTSCRSFSYQGPWGNIDNVSQTVTGDLHVSGWAFDPSLPTTPIQVHVYVDGKGTALTADRSRPDIEQAFPGKGSAHGFDADLPVGTGTHRVCLFAINVGVTGVNPLLGCRDLDFTYTAPFGVVDSVSPIGDGKLSVSGWVVDPDVPVTPVLVHNYVDGRWAGAIEASGSRPDIAAAFPGSGPSHGFRTVLDVGTGAHRVCTFAINIGVAGTNPLLACRDVTAFDRAPIGSLDFAGVSSPGQLTVSGWAFDPDSPTATTSVRVSVDGVPKGEFPANTSRPDVGAVYGSAGSNHGYGVTVPVSAGAHDVCVSALSTATAATPATLRCARVTS